MEHALLFKGIFALALSASFVVLAAYAGDTAKKYGAELILYIWLFAAVLIAAISIVENQAEEFMTPDAIEAAVLQCPSLRAAIQKSFEESEKPITRRKFVELRSIACKQEVMALQLRAIEEKPEPAERK